MANQNESPLLPTLDEDEQFVSSEGFMSADTALDWDALVTRGNSSHSQQTMSKWERDSLYVKFDPLIASRKDPADRVSFLFKAPKPPGPTRQNVESASSMEESLATHLPPPQNEEDLQSTQKCPSPLHNEEGQCFSSQNAANLPSSPLNSENNEKSSSPSKDVLIPVINVENPSPLSEMDEIASKLESIKLADSPPTLQNVVCPSSHQLPEDGDDALVVVSPESPEHLGSPESELVNSLKLLSVSPNDSKNFPTPQSNMAHGLSQPQIMINPPSPLQSNNTSASSQNSVIFQSANAPITQSPHQNMSRSQSSFHDSSSSFHDAVSTPSPIQNSRIFSSLSPQNSVSPSSQFPESPSSSSLSQNPGSSSTLSQNLGNSSLVFQNPGNPSSPSQNAGSFSPQSGQSHHPVSPLPQSQDPGSLSPQSVESDHPESPSLQSQNTGSPSSLSHDCESPSSAVTCSENPPSPLQNAEKENPLTPERNLDLPKSPGSNNNTISPLSVHNMRNSDSAPNKNATKPATSPISEVNLPNKVRQNSQPPLNKAARPTPKNVRNPPTKQKSNQSKNVDSINGNMPVMKKTSERVATVSAAEIRLKQNVDEYIKQKERHDKAIEERDFAIEERNEALRELAKVEARFAEMLALYEEVKAVTTIVDKNCIILQKREEILAHTIQRREERDQATRDMCNDVLEKMQRDFDARIREKEAENMKLKAKIRMCEMKTTKLEGEIAQVDRESESLRNLCEDLMKS